ncbi:MAG TPA: hypothetical protein VJP76_08735, partial [Candidatus Tumulicola sp.]|nr:hypothetical protein [Candidatus Tumulicola sp.]
LGGAWLKVFEIGRARRHLRKAVALQRKNAVDGAIGAYNNLADLELHVGRLDYAQRALQNIEERSARVSSEVGYGCVLMTQCHIALLRQTYPQAIAVADRTIAWARPRGDRVIEGEGLRCKGMAQLACGQDAVETLTLSQRALAEGGAADTARDAAAMLSLAHARAGHPKPAIELARQVMSLGDMAPASLWAAAQALHLAGADAHAAHALRQAHDGFQERIRRLSTPGDREAFAAIPPHRELVAAHANGVWPQRLHEALVSS